MIDRYACKQMQSLFSDEHRFEIYLKTEIASVHAFQLQGIIPESDYIKIKDKARTDVKRIKEIELTTQHDVVAFTRQVSETLGPERKWIHYELTSSDIIDTSMAYIYKEANEIIEKEIIELQKEVAKKALEYKNTPCIGRTHGMQAEVTSFGLKWALYYDELKRDIMRFKDARNTIEVGKISGAVGNFADVDPIIQDTVCQELKIGSANISTQVIQRDRHAYYGSVLAVIASTYEKIATEIRNLSRSEIHEVEENFLKGQKGSSAMPQKRNPVSSENICGCARMMRGYTIPLLEDNALYHERDISHSSVERVALIDMIELFEYMTKRMTVIISGLAVFPSAMLKNIKSANNSVFSGPVVNKLIEKGMSREAAYDMIQPLAMKAALGGEDFKEALEKNSQITALLTPSEIMTLFSLERSLRNIDNIYNRVGLEN